MHSEKPCVVCSRIKVKGQWWFLFNYYELNGYFCSECFGKVYHQNGLPRHKAEYLEILDAQKYSLVFKEKRIKDIRWIL